MEEQFIEILAPVPEYDSFIMLPDLKNFLILHNQSISHYIVSDRTLVLRVSIPYEYKEGKLFMINQDAAIITDEHIELVFTRFHTFRLKGKTKITHSDASELQSLRVKYTDKQKVTILEFDQNSYKTWLKNGEMVFKLITKNEDTGNDIKTVKDSILHGDNTSDKNTQICVLSDQSLVWTTGCELRKQKGEKLEALKFDTELTRKNFAFVKHYAVQWTTKHNITVINMLKYKFLDIETVEVVGSLSSDLINEHILLDFQENVKLNTIIEKHGSDNLTSFITRLINDKEILMSHCEQLNLLLETIIE